MKDLHEEVRRDVQYDPRNKRSAVPKRVSLSFWWIFFIFVALGLTAAWIMSRGAFRPW